MLLFWLSLLLFVVNAALPVLDVVSAVLLVSACRGLVTNILHFLGFEVFALLLRGAGLLPRIDKTNCEEKGDLGG